MSIPLSLMCSFVSSNIFQKRITLKYDLMDDYRTADDQLSQERQGLTLYNNNLVDIAVWKSNSYKPIPGFNAIVITQV